MARKRSKDISEDLGRRVSAFQGHLLRATPGAEAPASSSAFGALADVGIHDAEQLVAVAAIDESRDYLADHLSIPPQELEALVREAKREISPRVLEVVGQPVSPLFGLGAREPTPEMVARFSEFAPTAESLAVAALPPAVNLISKMSPIRNQASRGTCVAFCLTAIHEYLARVQRHPFDFSEQHLYYETKQIDGHTNDCGTWQAFAAQILAQRGQCREPIWPYNPNPPCNNHGSLPSGARPDAKRHLMRLQQLPSRDVNSIKARLAARQPAAISIPVYDSWYRSAETVRTGRITLRLGNEPSVGGHAICLAGYQDDSSAPGGGYFIVRNSWHTTWGSQCPYGAGYGTIPYQYITNDCWEAFALAEPAGQEEREAEDASTEDSTQPRTVTIRVKGDVNLVIT
jgi:C1A family cysteine protease